MVGPDIAVAKSSFVTNLLTTKQLGSVRKSVCPSVRSSICNMYELLTGLDFFKNNDICCVF